MIKELEDTVLEFAASAEACHNLLADYSHNSKVERRLFYLAALYLAGKLTMQDFADASRSEVDSFLRSVTVLKFSTP